MESSCMSGLRVSLFRPNGNGLGSPKKRTQNVYKIKKFLVSHSFFIKKQKKK